jgi:hypothetical protein
MIQFTETKETPGPYTVIIGGSQIISGHPESFILSIHHRDTIPILKTRKLCSKMENRPLYGPLV